MVAVHRTPRIGAILEIPKASTFFVLHSKQRQSTAWMARFRGLPLRPLEGGDLYRPIVTPI